MRKSWIETVTTDFLKLHDSTRVLDTSANTTKYQYENKYAQMWNWQKFIPKITRKNIEKKKIYSNLNRYKARQAGLNRIPRNLANA